MKKNHKFIHGDELARTPWREEEFTDECCVEEGVSRKAWLSGAMRMARLQRGVGGVLGSPARRGRYAYFSAAAMAQGQGEERRCEEEEGGNEPPRSPIYSRGGVTGALVHSYRGMGRIECGQETLWPKLWPCISHTRGST